MLDVISRSLGLFPKFFFFIDKKLPLALVSEGH